MDTKTNFEKVIEFREQFHLPSYSQPSLLKDEDFLFRYQLCAEELLEIMQAHRKGSVADFADGLADLLYVVYGLAHESGIPIDMVFAEVHRANMQKIRTTRENPGKRNSTNDVAKPADWKPPDIVGVLARYR